MAVGRYDNLEGKRFGRLVVGARAPYTSTNHLSRWNVTCDCGNSKVVYAQNLKRGDTTSCGCKQKEVVAELKPATKHGLRYTPENKLWRAARERSKQLNMPSDIEVSDIVIPTHCPLLGIELKAGIGGHLESSPSLDRIDNTKGYIKGNVWVISRRANTLKNNATLTELELLVSNLKKHIEEAA